METVHIRQAALSDLGGLYRIVAEAGSSHEPRYFERCLAEQDDQKRIIFVAAHAGELIGYAQLIWSPSYPPFRRLDIPEVQDLNVIPAARRRGAGGRLVDACEERALEAGKTGIGISVGLSSDYGAAQRLYVRKSYIPDGAGVCYDDIPVRASDMRPVDGQFTLKLLKKLNP